MLQSDTGLPPKSQPFSRCAYRRQQFLRAITLFGPGSGVALATVVGVLAEVPVMLEALPTLIQGMLVIKAWNALGKSERDLPRR